MINLTIISHVQGGQKGRVLRQYPADGIPTIGTWDNEPYAIRVSNLTNQLIQVKISVDGTDILNGGLATKEPIGKMFVIEPFKYMERSTWPEDWNGGGQFVFTNVKNTVATHTHGDLSALGYISCAIFVEGYTPKPAAIYDPQERGRKGSGQGVNWAERSATTVGVISLASADPGPGTGVGAWQEEHLTQAKRRLQKPIFSHLCCVRYLWWDDLEDRLRAQFIDASHPTGFVGINLGSTPRLETAPAPLPATYSRFG